MTAYLARSGDDKGAKAVASLLRRKAEANATNVNTRNKCFDCILKLNELKKPEEDGKSSSNLRIQRNDRGGTEGSAPS